MDCTLGRMLVMVGVIASVMFGRRAERPTHRGSDRGTVTPKVAEVTRLSTGQSTGSRRLDRSGVGRAAL